MWVACLAERTGTTQQGVCRLSLQVHRYHRPICPRYHCTYRPEEEEGWALPHSELGLDTIALVGSVRIKLNHRHKARYMQYHFRQSPEKYLAALEEMLIKEKSPT